MHTFGVPGNLRTRVSRLKERLKGPNVYDWGIWCCIFLGLAAVSLNLTYPFMAAVGLEFFFIYMSYQYDKKHNRDNTYNRHDLW